MTMFKLCTTYEPAGDQKEAILQLTEGANAGLLKQVLLGVTGSGKTFTMANVIKNLERPTLIMAPNKTLAAQLYGEFRQFFPENAVEYFVSYYDYYQPEAYVPTSGVFIEKDAAVNAHIEQMRLSATKALIERRDVVIVATVSAIYGLGDPNSWLRMVLHVSRGEKISEREILKRLTEMQYTRNQQSLERGQFRAHGETIDVFPADSNKAALRIELFDGVVEALSEFDPLTGDVLLCLPRTTVFPKTHYTTPRETILETIELVKVEMQAQVEMFTKSGKLIEAQRVSERTNFDIEMMLELGYCTGIENYSRYLSKRNAGEPPPTLFDYLPEDALLMIDESHVTIPQIGGMYRGDRARKETLVEYGFRLPSALDNRPLRFEEFEARALQSIYVSATPGPYELSVVDAVVEQVVRPTGLLDPLVEVKPASQQVDDALSEIHQAVSEHARVLITTLTRRMAEDLTTYLSEHGVKARYLHADIDTVERVEIIRDLRLGIFDVLVGINLLREGLDMPEVALVLILDADREGFLRSERSLVQTIGRAARNLKGRVILYADKITDSMARAMEETERRRARQEAYNLLHGITPKGVIKEVADILEKPKKPPKVIADLPKITPHEWSKKLTELEKTMKKHADAMEFEQAAKVRDAWLALQNAFKDFS